MKLNLSSGTRNFLDTRLNARNRKSVAAWSVNNAGRFLRGPVAAPSFVCLCFRGKITAYTHQTIMRKTVSSFNGHLSSDAENKLMMNGAVIQVCLITAYGHTSTDRTGRSRQKLVRSVSHNTGWFKNEP